MWSMKYKDFLAIIIYLEHAAQYSDLLLNVMQFFVGKIQHWFHYSLGGKKCDVVGGLIKPHLSLNNHK